METLWSNAHTEPEWSWKSSARQKLNDFESQVLAAVDAGVKSYSGQTTWSFANSIIYSISLISTIGMLFCKKNSYAIFIDYTNIKKLLIDSQIRRQMSLGTYL